MHQRDSAAPDSTPGAARYDQCACPEQQASGNIPQSETAQEEEEEEEAAALQISRMQQVIYGSGQFDLKMC